MSSLKLFRRWLDIQLQNIPKEFYPLLVEEARKAADAVRSAKQQGQKAPKKEHIKRIAAGLILGYITFNHCLDKASWWIDVPSGPALIFF